MAKVKRYKNIYLYKRRRKSPLKIVLWCVVAIVLVFVGYSATGPAIRFFKGEPIARVDSSKPSASSKAVSSKAGTSSKSGGAANTAGALRGLYLPETYLSDTGTLQGVASGAKAAGLNLAVVNMKGEDGLLHYKSQLPEVTQNSLMAPNAPDAKAAATVLKNSGLTPAARIVCFLDPAASDVMRDASVLYAANSTGRWRDSNNDFWLNPYSDKAQQYLIDISKELVSLGYTYILLDDVRFPSESGSAYYGNVTATKQAELTAFIANAQKQITAAGGKLIVRFDAYTAIGTGSPNAGLNQNMYALNTDYLSPEFCPSALDKSGVQVSGKTITKPDTAPASTVLSLAQYAATQVPAANKAKVIPYLQAYTNTALSAGFYKQYAAADISGEIASLKEAGFTSYILYSPQGQYDLTGVTTK